MQGSVQFEREGATMASSWTIVGCWLAKHGYQGPRALDRLDELWKQCPKSITRQSPETHRQEQYILDWSES